eukprot:938485-Rhodomonas_salina.1
MKVEVEPSSSFFPCDTNTTHNPNQTPKFLPGRDRDRDTDSEIETETATYTQTQTQRQRDRHAPRGA